NDGSTTRMCSQWATGAGSIIAYGSSLKGPRLSARRGVPMTCPECVRAADCTGGVCSGFVCQPPTCFDGVRNGAESDVDCGGGLCALCASGSGCVSSSDCATGICFEGVCVSFGF